MMTIGGSGGGKGLEYGLNAVKRQEVVLRPIIAGTLKRMKRLPLYSTES